MFLMAGIKVPTSFNIEVEFEIPEFYRRILALVLDMIVELVYLILSIRFLSDVFRNSGGREAGTVIFYLFVLLPILLYHVLMEVTMNGQSIGKRVMGIRVVNENGGRASLDQFVIRWLLRISDTWIVSLLILLSFEPGSIRDAETAFVVLGALAFLATDIILVVSSPKSQRIGDILARTILIRTHAKTSIEETIFQEVADSYTPVFPSIMRLSDKDINAIKNILQTARKRGDYEMAHTAANKIKGYLKIESHMPPFDFLEVLLKDYNYLSVK